MNENVITETNQQQDIKTNPSKQRNFLLLFIFILLIIGTIIYLFLNYTHLFNVNKKFNSNDVILKVGNENIYQKDIALERMYPESTSSSYAKLSDKEIQNKLIDDSIALQSAQKEGWLKLDSTNFNNVNKIYPLRANALAEIHKKFENADQPAIDVEVISMYYHNYPYIPPIGIDKARNIIKEKIETLHDQVKAGSLTMEQVADVIKNDTSLKQIDPAFKQNAYRKYHGSLNQPNITFAQELNNLLWKADPGQVTDVVEGMDYDPQSKQTFPSVFMFGKVDNKVQKSQTFTEWLATKKKEYHVTTY